MTAAIALLIVAIALVVTVSILARLLVSQQRAHARREDLLVNELLHAVGKPWLEAPAVAEAVARRRQPDDLQRPGWTATPEQYIAN